MANNNAPAVVPLTGLVWNQNYIVNTFAANPAYSENFISGINHGVLVNPFEHEHVPYHAAVLGHGALLLDNSEYNFTVADIDLIVSGCMGGINIPVPAEPKTKYLNLVRIYISWFDQAPVFDTADMQLRETPEDGIIPAAADNLYDVQEEKAIPTTFNKAYEYVEKNIEEIKTLYDLSSRLTRVSSMIVSLCKGGTVSKPFLKKISKGIMTDIGVSVTMNENHIRRFHERYVRGLSPESAAEFFARVLNWIPEHALRMRLTIEQCTDHGITGLLLVKKALTQYPHFDWTILDFISPGELSRVEAGLIKYNHKPYAGFQKNLGDMAGPRFKVAVYTAKNLLIKLGGETSLNRYKGGDNGPHEKIDEAIEFLAAAELPTADGRIVVDELNPQQVLLHNAAKLVKDRLALLIVPPPAVV